MVAEEIAVSHDETAAFMEKKHLFRKALPARLLLKCKTSKISSNYNCSAVAMGESFSLASTNGRALRACGEATMK
jgi:hypothetical protein